MATAANAHSAPTARAVPTGRADAPSKSAPSYPQPKRAKVGNRPLPVAPGAALVRETSPAEQDEEDAEKPPSILRAAPPWLVSLIVHIVILIVAALIFIVRVKQPSVDIVIVKPDAKEDGEQLKDEILDFAPLDEVEVDKAVLTPEDLQPVDDPLATPPENAISVDATSSMSNLTSPTIGLALTGREAGMKKALLAAYGGNATTEAAVLNGLLWLKKNQRKDGSWSLAGPYRDGASENQIAATAMALLAFQGAGNTHEKGQFKKQVADGWNWLLKQQQQDGGFMPDRVGHNQRLYTHAQATIALCELLGMTGDSHYQDAAQRAVDFAIKAQSAQGGWRYVPREDADMSVTGWFVMALQSAMMAGLEVPTPTLQKVHKFLDSVAVDGGRRYKYQPGRAENKAMSAEGLLCRQYLGWKQDDPRLVDGVARVAANPVDYSDENVYYWYYGTQTAHHMEGDAWERWNRVMKAKVPKQQVQSGPEAGSWSPREDEWGLRGGGRLYTTCLSIYMLEVYYRHLPIYQRLRGFQLKPF